MKLAIGSDHAGYEAKEGLARWLGDNGHEVENLGTDGPDSVDYPAFAFAVGRRVASGGVDLGVLVCGTGIGMSIAANRLRGVRAARCTDAYSARMARRHNDANVLCVGARISGRDVLLDILATFVSTPFDGGRHRRRVDRIDDVDEEGR